MLIRQLAVNPGKDVNEEKWCDAEDRNFVAEKPEAGGIEVFGPGDGMICEQAGNANDTRNQSGDRGDGQVAQYVTALSQAEIDRELAAQNIGSHTIRGTESHRTDGSAISDERLVVNQNAGRGGAASHKQGVPRADGEHECQANARSRVPGNRPQFTDDDYFGAIEEEKADHKRNRGC